MRIFLLFEKNNTFINCHLQLQPNFHTTYHLDQSINPYKYHIPNFIHFSPSIFPYSPPTQNHICTYAKNKNQMTKTTLTNTTQPPQHLFHNMHRKHNQTSYRLQHKHNQTNTTTPPLPMHHVPYHNYFTKKSTLPSWTSCYNALTNQDTINYPIHLCCCSPYTTDSLFTSNSSRQCTPRCNL